MTKSSISQRPAQNIMWINERIIKARKYSVSLWRTSINAETQLSHLGGISIGMNINIIDLRINVTSPYSPTGFQGSTV